MAHPRMFDDDDPLLARVRELAFDLPEAAEKVSHGRPCFFTKKVFCYYGGSLKVDGEWVWNECAGVFNAWNVDSMFFSVVLGLLFIGFSVAPPGRRREANPASSSPRSR